MKAGTLAVVLALAAHTATVADGSPALRDFNDSRMSWIRRCSHAAVVEVDLGWAIDSGAESEEVFHCLLANADLVDPQNASDAEASARYRPPFVNGWSLRGDPSHLPEALIRTATKVFIVAGGDTGIEGLLHVAGDCFLVSVGFASYVGIYKLSVEGSGAVYLTNGFDVAIEDPAVPTFRVSESSAYFSKGGRFWFDAIIDNHGRILDLPTTEGRCLTTKDLQARSRLDLSHVKRRQVCIIM